MNLSNWHIIRNNGFINFLSFEFVKIFLGLFLHYSVNRCVEKKEKVECSNPFVFVLLYSCLCLYSCICVKLFFSGVFQTYSNLFHTGHGAIQVIETKDGREDLIILCFVFVSKCVYISVFLLYFKPTIVYCHTVN